jgi:hypothetical protein
MFHELGYVKAARRAVQWAQPWHVAVLLPFLAASVRGGGVSSTLPASTTVQETGFNSSHYTVSQRL